LVFVVLVAAKSKTKVTQHPTNHRKFFQPFTRHQKEEKKRKEKKRKEKKRKMRRKKRAKC